MAVEISVNYGNTLKNWSSMMAALRDSRKPMSIIALKGAKDVNDHFLQGMGPDGKWAPLKPATVIARSKRHANKKKSWSIKPLIDRGILRMSVRGGVRGNDATIQAGGMADTYAGVHNSGAPGRNIPQRKFLYISDAALQNMTVTYLRYIMDAHGGR